MKRTRPDGIFWLTLVWICGLLCSRLIVLPILLLFISAGILLSLAIFLKQIRAIFLFLIVFLLAQVRFQLFNQPKSNSLDSIFQTKKSFVQPIEGRIISEIIKREKNYRFTLEILTINDVSASGRIYFYTKEDSLRYGDIIRTVGNLQAFAEVSNPYSFDFNEFMQYKKIVGSGFAKTAIVIINSRRNPLQSSVISTRRWLRRRIEQRFGKESGFYKAIIIGEKAEIDELSSRLSRAGLSHLLAVSGLHVGILAFVFYLALKLLLRNRNIARIGLIITLVFYAAICNWSPSVTRAMLMISLLLLAKMLQRKVNANNIIAASLFIITILNPNQLFSVGLQLSYMAVFTLINLVPNMRLWHDKKEEKRTTKIIKQLFNAIFVIMFSSLILSFVLAPLTLYHFNQFNLNGIVANLLAIPMMTFMLPLALVCIFLPGGIATIYVAALRFCFLIFDKWSLAAANLPMHFTFIRFSIIQFFIAVVLIIIFPFFLQKKKYQYLLVIIFILNVAYSFIVFSSNNLLITFFDCGLGDMMLLETADKERMMIDSGPPEFSQGHIAQSAQSYFQKKGISTIDWLIITHAHNDHYGGLEWILKELKVKQLVVTDDFQKRSIWHYFKPLLSENTSVFTIRDTLTLPLKNISCKVLHPDSSFYHTNINNMSIVVKITYQDLNIIVTGDLEEEGEHRLVECS
jgi:competence protein ComEC